MSDDYEDDYRRGERPLAFDSRRRVAEGRPAPVALIVSAFVLVALVVAIFIFYRSGVKQGGGEGDVVGAPVGEMKSAAPAASQPSDPAAGLQIYRAEDAANAAGDTPPTFTAPPEQPVSRVAVPTPTPPVVVTQTPAPAPAPAPAAAPPAAKPTPAPTPAATKPAPTPAPQAPKPASVPPAASAAGGSAVVQIGALSSEALADQAWTAAAGGSGHGKRIERIERDGKTLYRTSVTGFAGRPEAQAFCERLKAGGKSCFVK